MQITYAFRHMDTSDRAKEHTANKLGRLSRLEDGEMSVDVVFTAEKQDYRAEFRVNDRSGNFIIGETRSDLFEAINVAVDRLDQTVSERKARLKDRRA